MMLLRSKRSAGTLRNIQSMGFAAVIESRRMKIHDAKEYVAGKLGIEIIDLTNEEVMRQLREDLGLGLVTSVSGSPKGIRAKMKIAEFLEIRINSVELFKSQIGYADHVS